MGTDAFTYDRVSRITSADIGGSYFTYSYDVHGSRLDTVDEDFKIEPGTNRYKDAGGPFDGIVSYDDWGRLTRWADRGAPSMMEYDEMGIWITWAPGITARAWGDSCR